jgi:ATP-dependent protease ClpP protease subunit
METTMNELLLYGSVGDSWWDEEFFTAASVRAALKGMSGPLTVRINSGGGIASEGQAIYTALKDYDGEVTVVVDGVAASAASLIAMAGDEIVMRMGSWMLVHDPAQWFGAGRGTADDHMALAGFLDKIAVSYASIYAKRSGMDIQVAREVMRAETVYTGEEAVAAGFATSYEGDQEAAEAATFDYRLYMNAPADLRKASERFGPERKEMAAVAVLAGAARMKMEADMAPKHKAVAAQVTAEIEDEIEAPVVTEVEDEPEVETPAGDEPTAKAKLSGAQVNRLHMLGATMKLAPADVVAIAQTAASMDAALDRMSAKAREAQGEEVAMHGAPTNRILRDERTTMRAGMTGALVAQFNQAEPQDGNAQRFMGMSIVELAATCIDHKGSIRTPGERLSVLQMASHSTSDFPAIFENALNKTLLERYQVQQPTYRDISRRRDFQDFRVHPMVRAGDFPELQAIAEGGEIKYGTVGESKETAVLSSYAVALSITRQMMINDEMGAIGEVLSDYGSMVANFEEKTFYSFLASATLADGNAVFRTQRGNLAGSAGPLNKTTLSAARAAIRKQTSLGGHKLNLAPAILLVGPDKETEADSIVAQINADQIANVNPFSGRLRVIVTAQITDHAWYVFANPAAAGGAVFIHGFLNGGAAPRVRMDEPFGRQGMSVSVEHDFGTGAIDYRGAYKNAGTAP